MRAIDRPWKKPRRIVLNKELAALVTRHGYKAVEASLKQHTAQGRPKSSEIELRQFIGKADALAMIGAAPKNSATAMKKRWAETAPEHQRPAYMAQADRMLPSRGILGLAIAVNEHWHQVSLAQQRGLLEEALKWADQINDAGMARLIAELIDGPIDLLAEKPVSTGLIRDPPGLPRFKPEMDCVAEWLLDQAFPWGRET